MYNLKGPGIPEKPDEVRQRIDEMFPEQSKLELFARKKVDGWDMWGLEIKQDVNFDNLF